MKKYDKVFYNILFSFILSGSTLVKRTFTRGNYYEQINKQCMIWNKTSSDTRKSIVIILSIKIEKETKKQNEILCF